MHATKVSRNQGSVNVRNEAWTRQKVFNKSSKELGMKVSKEGSKELGKRVCKNSSKQVGKCA